MENRWVIPGVREGWVGEGQEGSGYGKKGNTGVLAMKELLCILVVVVDTYLLLKLQRTKYTHIQTLEWVQMKWEI